MWCPLSIIRWLFCAGRNTVFQSHSPAGTLHGMGVNALNFAGFHPYSPMFFFPSNMSTCKLWQKFDYALRTRELNFPKMETFKGNSVVFNSVFVCTANHMHQVGKAALRGFFFLPGPMRLLHFRAHRLHFTYLTRSVGLCHWWCEQSTGVSAFKHRQLGPLFCKERPENYIHLLLLVQCSSFWLSQAASRLGTSCLGLSDHLQSTFWCIFYPRK